VRYVENPGWHDELETPKDRWFGDLVLDIGIDAEAASPVDTGRMKAEVYAETEGDTGYIGSKAPYTLYVHEGHRVAWRGADGEIHYNGHWVPGQPFLTSALFRAR